MFDLETFVLSISLLIIISVTLTRWGSSAGLPVLLLFITVGMLAGSEGPGGIHFDNAQLSQNIGVISLIYILFSGGLDTKWTQVKTVAWSALSLATIGVLLTAIFLGGFVYFVLDLPILIALLLGSIVASTDAAAVFAILRSKSINLKGDMKPLLELESGSNDPMAIFLTVSMLELLTNPESSWWQLILTFVLQMGLGFVLGVAGGRLMVVLINKLRFYIESLYTIFVLAFAAIIYAITAKLNGSGFLAVYVAGITINHFDIVHKKGIVRFFDGMAWLGQIIMFLTLGLLVFPSQVIEVIPYGMLISFFLILVARPVGVFISLLLSEYNFREKVLVSWVGLRGAVPVVLATFPLIAGVEEAQWIFNVVFFIVLTSALFQGWSIPVVAKWLKLAAPEKKKIYSPIEFIENENIDMELLNLSVPNDEAFKGKALVEIPSLKGSLVVLIHRKGNYFVPSGGTVLEPGDMIEVLVQKEKKEEIFKFFQKSS